MKLTEQYDGHFLTRSVVLPRNPRIKMEWLFTIVQHTARVIDPILFSLIGRLCLRSTRQACFFSRLNPQDSSSRQRTIDWTGPGHEPRMVLYKQTKRPNHDCISFFNLRRGQDANLVFHQSSSDAIMLYDSMPASALDKVVTFAGEVLFQRNSPTSIKPMATLGDRIDLCISGQFEELCALNKKEAQVFLISNLMKQVLKSPNKSNMINDLIKNLQRKMQQESITILYHIEIQKLMLFKTVAWNDMKFSRSKIVFSATCASKIKDQSRQFVLTEEVKKQAEQRINSRFTMYVLWAHKLALKNTQRCRRDGNSAASQNSEGHETTWLPRRNIIAERSWSATSRKRACTNKDTRSPDMEEFDRIASAKRSDVAALGKGRIAGTNTRSYNPIKEEAATPLRPKNTFKTNKMYSGKGRKLDQSISRTRCRTVVIVVIMDMVTFDKVFLVGFLVFATMATITTIYLICCPSTRPEQNAENKLRGTCSCDTCQWEQTIFYLRVDNRRLPFRTGVYADTHSHAHFSSVVVGCSCS